jgi:hypothetical protein
LDQQEIVRVVAVQLAKLVRRQMVSWAALGHLSNNQDAEDTVHGCAIHVSLAEKTLQLT